jgi:glycosyltransferase involved in cell wall biosynthesis
VDPYDEQDIAKGMRNIIEDQNIVSQLKAKGLQRSKEFTWQKTAARHIEILDRLT